MIDIVSAKPGSDLGLFDTDIEKAKNILSVQIGDLEYAPDLGIDLRYFLSENVLFQNESFRSYLIEVLASNSINVTEVIEQVESLYEKYTFKITAQDTSTSLVAR